jgi:hypothetical protein
VLHSWYRVGSVTFLRLSVNDVSVLKLGLDGTRAETRFCLSVKRKSPCDLAGATGQSTTGS